jgi:hypothetical protein
MKEYGEVESVGPIILNVGTRSLVTIVPQALYLRRNMRQ